MTKLSEFTIGSDPEVFLRKGDGPASAHGLLPGDKANPFKTEGGAIQVDGMAAEFNTDPCSIEDADTFSHRVASQLVEIEKRIPEDHSIYIEPTQEFGKEFLEGQPFEAKELGCDPDYNAYTGEVNPRPDGDEATFRTGAGHIHVGWGSDIPVDNEEHFKICQALVKQLDCTVGCFMVLIDDDTKRASLYGKAGAFRPKPYGVEYRTPSNVWIKTDLDRRIIANLVKDTVSFSVKGYSLSYGNGSKRCIDQKNKAQALRSIQYLSVSGALSEETINLLKERGISISKGDFKLCFGLM